MRIKTRMYAVLTIESGNAADEGVISEDVGFVAGAERGKNRQDQL